MSITATIPISRSEDGVIRVGATRVTLDTLVGAFKSGATPEEIVFQYPVLELADVYAVISYYLNNREYIESYLQNAHNISETLHTSIAHQFPASDIRQRLLARLTGTSKSDD